MARSAFWIQQYEEALERGADERAAVAVAQAALADRWASKIDAAKDAADEEEQQ